MTGTEGGSATSVLSGRLVLGLEQVDRSRVAEVGGKGAHLGELLRIEGVEVPPGFVVTTGAFRRAVAQAPSLVDRLDRLSHVDPGDHDAVAAASADVRAVVATLPVPDDVAAAVRDALADARGTAAWAVRSSATAEDLPAASFAGQQDTFLNAMGAADVLEHVRLCWASLFTDRAVTYRRRHGVDDAAVAMAVVVQRMVLADVSGVLFTADPVTSHRGVVAVEAVLGLGESLVSGVADADRWTVRAGADGAATSTRRSRPSRPRSARPLPGGRARCRSRRTRSACPR